MLNKFKSKIKIQDDKTENVLQIQKIKKNLTGKLGILRIPYFYIEHNHCPRFLLELL